MTVLKDVVATAEDAAARAEIAAEAAEIAADEATAPAEAVVTAAIAAAKLAPRSQETNLPVSNRVGFVGDSITNASGATANNGFVHQVRWIAGTRIVDQVYRVYATSGFTSAQVLATHIPTAAASDCGVIHVAVGTNDAGTGVTPAQFEANIQAMYDQLVAAGKRMSISLIPPRGSGATVQWRRDRASYNEIITRWAQTHGVPVADTLALVDPATGYLRADCDSGDGTHPNDLGHALIAEAVAIAVVTLLPVPAPLQVKAPSVNLVSGGNMGTAPASGLPAGWSEKSGGTGTAPVYSTIADTSGELHEGLWLQMDWTATAGGVRTIKHGHGALGTDFAATELLDFACLIQIDDLGGYEAAVRAGTAGVRVVELNTGDGVQAIAVPTKRSPIVGPVGYRLPAPNTSFPAFAVEVTAPAGVHVKVRVGAVVVRNLAVLGVLKTTS